jgi:hypothetical protein
MKNSNVNVHLMIGASVPDYVKKISMEAYISAVTKILSQTGLSLEEKKNLIARIMSKL